MRKTYDTLIYPLVIDYTILQTTENSTLSLHDALPISWSNSNPLHNVTCTRVTRASMPCSTTSTSMPSARSARRAAGIDVDVDRKSTRLNSSHANISYAVFCLKKKRSEVPHRCAGIWTE